MLALLVAGPMLAQPATHSARFSVGEAVVNPANRQMQQASIVDDIIDVIDDIIDDLTGGGGSGGSGGNP